MTALVEGEPRRAATIARGLADEYAGPAGPAAVLLGRIVATTPDATTLELSSTAGLGDRVAPLAVRAAARSAATTPPTRSGVAAAALGLGVPADRLAGGLASFAGVGRRLERKGEAGGVVVYDDYGHHPTAIRETLAAVRQREPGRRVWAVYEPLTFHRTAALLDDFAAVLADGGRASRSPTSGPAAIPTRRSRRRPALAEAVAARNPAIPVAAPGSVEATARWLAGEVRPGDAVLVMGGGRSYRIGELLLELLADR